MKIHSTPRKVAEMILRIYVLFIFLCIYLFQKLHSPDSVVWTDVSGIFYSLCLFSHMFLKLQIMYTVLYTHTFFFARNQTFEDKNVRSDFELCLRVPLKN